MKEKCVVLMDETVHLVLFLGVGRLKSFLILNIHKHIKTRFN